jgi:putative transposase
MTGHKLARSAARSGSAGRRRTARRANALGALRGQTRAEDRVVAAQIRAVIRTRGSYGYRRATALVNRAFGAQYNRKRIRRVMELHGWNLPRPSRRRTGRAHAGRIRRDGPNERWCSDVLEIACWSGELVQLGFALDCHDRECLSSVSSVSSVARPRDLTAADIRQLMRQAVAARLGEARPRAPIEWLSANGGIYTALDTSCTAERFGPVPITTPAYSPQSNGMAEAFVNTLRRDSLAGADRGSAAAILAQLPAWIADYNGIAPHAALAYRAPLEYRQRRVEEASTR